LSLNPLRADEVLIFIGYIIISILLGALVGFSLFARDTLHSREGR
jgi:hypothetical protein